MAIEFEFYENPSNSEEDKAKYHPRTVIAGIVDTDQLIKEIHISSSLTPGDIRAVLVSLSNMLTKHLGNSKQVNIDGLGQFRPTLYAVREIEPDKTRSQSVWFKTIKYKPDQTLKNSLLNVPTQRADIKRHSIKITDKEIDIILEEYFSKHLTLSRRKMEQICGLTRITALRHINRLIKEKKLENNNLKLQPVYIPAPGFYGRPATGKSDEEA